MLTTLISDSDCEMKISYLSSSPLENNAANCVHVMQMCQAFANVGYECTLHAVGVAKHKSHYYEQYGVEKNFNLNILSQSKIKYLGPIIFGFRQALNAKFKIKPDICYARCITSAYFAMRLGMRVVLELHEVPYSKPSRWLYKKLLNSKNLVRIVVISEALKIELSKEFPEILFTDIVVAHDGANNFQCQNNDSRTGDGQRNTVKVGYAGGLREGNGIALILKLAEENPNLQFHLAGGSSADVNSWRARTHARNIIWHGSKLPKEIPDFLCQNDILLAPYQLGPKTNAGHDTAKWMSPLKIFEYMAAGKVLMVSDFPVLREVLDDDIAVLIEPTNFDRWTRSIKQLADSESLRLKYGNLAKARFLEEYTWATRAIGVLGNLNISKEFPTIQPSSDS